VEDRTREDGSYSKESKPYLGLFETLESSCIDGFVQRYSEAHERSPHGDMRARLEGRIPRTGQRLREERLADSGNTGLLRTRLPDASILQPCRAKVRLLASRAMRGESRGGYWEREYSESRTSRTDSA
jgi:hypothetical protein